MSVTLPPSLCPFPDDGALIIDDVPGCSYVTIAAGDGPVLYEGRDRERFDPMRASIRVVHRGTRSPRVFHRRSSDPEARSRYSHSWHDDRCAFAGAIGAAWEAHWWPRDLPSGSDSHLLLGGAPGVRIDIAACIDAEPADTAAPSPAP